MTAAFDDAKTSFQSPDFSKIVLSAYRSGVSGVGGDKRHDTLRSAIQQTPAITCDTVVLTGDDDPVEGAPLPDEAVKRCFTGNFHHKVVSGTGHFIHRQRPDEVIYAILKL
jgi:pimeloyl-ACP methyl ester carboxylesterase